MAKKRNAKKPPAEILNPLRYYGRDPIDGPSLRVLSSAIEPVRLAPDRSPGSAQDVMPEGKELSSLGKGLRTIR